MLVGLLNKPRKAFCRVKKQKSLSTPKYFVTSRVMRDGKLHVVRNERLEVNTFGSATKDKKIGPARVV